MKIQFIAGTGKHELNITADIKHTVRERWKEKWLWEIAQPTSCEHFPFEVKHSCPLVALHTAAGLPLSCLWYLSPGKILKVGQWAANFPKDAVPPHATFTHCCPPLLCSSPGLNRDIMFINSNEGCTTFLGYKYSPERFSTSDVIYCIAKLETKSVWLTSTSLNTPSVTY